MRMSSSRHQAADRGKPKTARPKAYKVVLLNDDFTPREFVVSVLRSVFRMTSDQARAVMLTAHMRGSAWSRSIPARSPRPRRPRPPTWASAKAIR